MKRIMKCGCAANAWTTVDGKEIPSCAIHMCTEEAETQPELVGRKARCTYKCADSIVDSNINLAFFVYKGPGSEYAINMCKCGYYKEAHTPERRERLGYYRVCDNFTPAGPAEYDEYYDGCHGWD